APGKDCLIDPQINGADRSRAWAFVQGYGDALEGKATQEAQSWKTWQGQLAEKIGEACRDTRRHDELIRHMQRMGLVTHEVARARSRQHGTHLSGIVVNGNPFIELLAIRDAQTLAMQPAPDAVALKDRFDRIADYLS